MWHTYAMPDKSRNQAFLDIYELNEYHVAQDLGASNAHRERTENSAADYRNGVVEGCKVSRRAKMCPTPSGHAKVSPKLPTAPQRVFITP